MINSPCSKNVHLFLGIIHLFLLHWFFSDWGDASTGGIGFWERKLSQGHQYYSLLTNRMVNAWFLRLGACGAESDLMGTFVNWHWCGHHWYIAGGKGRGCADMRGPSVTALWRGRWAWDTEPAKPPALLRTGVPELFIAASPLPTQFQFCGLNRFKHKQ